MIRYDGQSDQIFHTQKDRLICKEAKLHLFLAKTDHSRNSETRHFRAEPKFLSCKLDTHAYSYKIAKCDLMYLKVFDSLGDDLVRHEGRGPFVAILGNVAVVEQIVKCVCFAFSSHWLCICCSQCSYQY